MSAPYAWLITADHIDDGQDSDAGANGPRGIRAALLMRLREAAAAGPDRAAEFPDVEVAYQHIDAATIHMVTDPGRFDVIVTDNLFGDILTDLGGAVAGGIGRAASANLNPARTGPSLFEPVHGSAPDIAGTGTADPRAAIVSAGLLLEFLGEAEAAARVKKAVDSSDDASGSTSEIGSKIAERV